MPWTTTPTPARRIPVRGWIAKVHLAASGFGVGNASATAVVRLAASVDGLGAAAAAARLGTVGNVYGVGNPAAAAIAKLTAAAGVDGVGTPAGVAAHALMAAAAGVGEANAAAAAVVVAAVTGTGVADAATIVRGVLAAADGSGTPAGVAAHAVFAPAEGTGTVSASTVAKIVAAATGIGDASANAITRAVLAPASGTGTPAAITIPKLTAAAEGVGTASGTAEEFISSDAVEHRASGTTGNSNYTANATSQVAVQEGDFVLAVVGNPGTGAVNGVTLDAVPMTRVTRVANNNSDGNGYTEMWGGFATSTGTKTVQTTLSLASMHGVTTEAYYNVGSAIPLPNVFGTNSLAMSHSLICGESERIVQSFNGPYTMAATSGGTLRKKLAGEIAFGAEFTVSDADVSTTFTAAQPFDFQAWSGMGILLSPNRVAYSAEGVGVSAVATSVSDTCAAAVGDTGYAWVATDSTDVPTGVTWGGVPMTMMATRIHDDLASRGAQYLYKLKNPPTGPQTVTATMSASNDATLYAIAYSGVESDEILATDASNTANPSSGPLTVLPGQMAVQGFSSYNTAYSASSGGTERLRIAGTGNRADLLVLDSATSTTFVGTKTAASWAGITLLLKTTKQAELIGYACGAGNSITLPPHEPGDTFLIYAHQGNRTATIPSLPGAGGATPTFTTPTGGTAGSINAARFGWATATTNAHTSGTWTNATYMEVFVIRNARVTGGPIGGCAMANNSITNFPCPAITMVRTDGTSIVLTVGGGGDNVNTMASTSISAAAPAGYVPLQRFWSSNRGIFANQKEITTTDGASTQANTSNVWGVYGTIEIVSV